MTGKAYTMQEMKQIVDYISEHRAYSEVKGRKMWMDFANSKMTNRSWQSMKETFLKRILPDITNPYYKLTMLKIASFREGHDVEKRLKNKLEVREADTENISNGNTNNDGHSSSDKNTEGKDKGEGHTNSKADRDSTETIVLSNCYETAEDIKRDLMTPDEESNDATKKIRDLLEFEPMTPDVQRLIDDFVSEDEGSDGEPRMQIDLEDRSKVGNAEEPITVSDTDETNIDQSNNDNKSEKEPANKPDNNSENTDNAQVEKVDSSSKEPEKDIPNVTTTEPVKEKSKSILNTSDSITSTHSTMPDSILPNNQEELNNTEKTNKKQLSLNNNDKNLKLLISNENQDKKSPAKRKNDRINSISSTNSEKREHRNVSKKSKMADEEVNMVVEVPAVPEVSKEDNIQEDESAQSQNPCLQSVNLYNETIDDAKHSESDDTIKLVNEQPSTSKEADTTKPPPKIDVVVLKSHSSSSSPFEPERKRFLIDSKRYKDHTLANVFGFKSGAIRRRSSHRKRSISQRTYDISSGSSDWTSESESEYVTPPRGRRNKHTKKYLKPKSSRVRSLEKNGGLFVVYNNRIYPLVKDGKVVKNYLNYASDDESDGDRKAWKRKYLEEKKRAEELERLLSHVQEKNRKEERAPKIAACSSTCSTLSKTKENKGQHPPHDPNSKEEAKQEAESKTVKIKFTKNNEEVQLEGPLCDITPALAQVMQLLQKSESDRPSPKSNVLEPKREITPSPVAVSLEDVHEKVNKIENEIFKEIEEHDKNESLINTEDKSFDSNVTKRSALRRRAQSSASIRSVTKKPKLDKEEKTPKKQETPQTDTETVRKTRSSSRTPRKIANEISKTESNISKKSSKAKTTEAPEDTAIETQETSDDSNVKYKFPSPPPTEKNTKVRNTRKKSIRYSKTMGSNISCSSESLQSYQSEASPPKVIVRIKPGCPTSTQNQNKIAPINYMTDETESSSSFPDVKQTITFHNSTLSEAYKSDSYQLLMPINISKTNKRLNVSKRDMSFARKVNETHRDLENDDGRSSSNISPPTSPVLSIVENLSISRSLLTSADDLLTDEMDQLESDHITLNKLMKSDENSPKPLMEQDCRFDSEHNDGVNYHYNIQVENSTLTPTSQSLVKKLNTISLKDFNVTDSVYVRLEKLKLDSTKKSNKKTTKEKENKAKAQETKTEKANTKKRSSTPRKKDGTRKTKKSKEATIEEEHVERNSCVSRNSCPAMLQSTDVDFNDTNTTVATKPRTSKELKKLNIIKVKITKPKDKIKDKTGKASTSKVEINSTQTSSQTDNSIDLIHNHSETCLQAHECIDNSVEIVEKSSSIISVNSETSNSASIFNIEEFLLEGLYNTNARDGIEETPETQTTAECPDLFYTPLGPLSSANSLMTEDLSIDIPVDIPEKTPTPGKWFLLSEDETSTNFDLNQNLVTKDVGYGANLNDLFPVTCAVPDLSTITEMSKENDADTRSNLNVSLPISKI